ncbi:hypothetical protein AVEN_253525-1 [Araneus ventricosus]|uniref:Uncharacterized protein n=1 Tax=Araneus ventricosus TaxID=182803 RepID=A0A4Y2BUP8_ARAVE|nr:hypothetical protein AVEN_253525-1 [Araneus ventricosus]
MGNVTDSVHDIAEHMSYAVPILLISGERCNARMKAVHESRGDSSTDLESSSIAHTRLEYSRSEDGGMKKRRPLQHPNLVWDAPGPREKKVV